MSKKIYLLNRKIHKFFKKAVFLLFPKFNIYFLNINSLRIDIFFRKERRYGTEEITVRRE